MIEHETEIFRAACQRLSITATKAPAIFNVTRQTFSSWIHGKTKIPHKAFISLLEFENRDFIRTAERIAQINETVERLNAGRALQSTAQPIRTQQRASKAK